MSLLNCIALIDLIFVLKYWSAQHRKYKSWHEVWFYLLWKRKNKSPVALNGWLVMLILWFRPIDAAMVFERSFNAIGKTWLLRSSTTRVRLRPSLKQGVYFIIVLWADCLERSMSFDSHWIGFGLPQKWVTIVGLYFFSQKSYMWKQ